MFVKHGSLMYPKVLQPHWLPRRFDAAKSNGLRSYCRIENIDDQCTHRLTMYTNRHSRSCWRAWSRRRCWVW